MEENFEKKPLNIPR